VIGVSQFADEHWRTLKYTAKDAEDVAAALRDPRRGQFDAVEVLTRPEQTTRPAVLDALEAMRRRATRPDDVVVVYVSSHGTLARDTRGELHRYLVTSEARFREVDASALRVDELKARFERLPSRQRVLVLATCHSGSGKSLLPDDVLAELASTKSAALVRPLEEVSRASVVLSASDWGETAREDDALKNDVYTHFLVEALDGRADRNLDGAVSATEAHDHARRQTYAHTQGRQRPSAEILEVGADPVILSGRVAGLGRPELYSYGARLEGFTLKVDGKALAELPGGAAVAPGGRTVELTKGGEVLLRRTLAVAPGERVDVEALLMATGARRTVSLIGAAFSFADSRSRAEVLPPWAALGVGLRLEDVLAPRLNLWLELTGSRGRQSLRLTEGGRVPFTFTALELGVALPYRWEHGRFRLFTGPKVAALGIGRSFQLEAYRGGQGYFTLVPGWMGAVAWSFGGRWELQLQGQGMLSYVVVDRGGRVLGFTGLMVGTGYRF
jgi:hypothetical protein